MKKEQVTQRRLDADVLLRHKFCRNSDCKTCLDDHQTLGEKLEWLTDNDSSDHLGKYHAWLSKNGITPETEWGWATPESFLKVNMEAYADDFLGIIDLKKLEKQIEEADEALEALQAKYRAETGRRHMWFR